MIPSTLVSQLEEKPKAGPPALATGAKLWLPTATRALSFKGDRQHHTQTDAQRVYQDN